MRMRLAAVGALCVGLCLGLCVGMVQAAAAQNNECAPYSGITETARVCNAAIDGTRAFHPLAGLLISGGNPVIGTARTLGGLGHLTVGIRANAAKVVLPDLNYDGSSATVPSDEEILFPSPSVEAGLGVIKGLPNGLFSVDVLASAQLLPTDQIDNLSIDDDATKIGSVGLGLGFGARVGILRERGLLPAISISVMRRTIPQIKYGDVPAGDDYSYAVDLQATNVRAVISKRLAILDLAVGYGWDKYTGAATIEFRDPVTSLPQPSIDIDLENKRSMLFADAGLNLSIVKLVAEAGYQTGKDQQLSTDFEDFDTTKGKWFAGAGIRFGF